MSTRNTRMTMEGAPRRRGSVARAFAAGLLAAIVGLVAGPSAAQAFELESFTSVFHEPVSLGPFDEPPAMDALPRATQAGSHPDLSVEFRVDTAVEGMRNVTVDLPAGFYGNPQSAPACTAAQFSNYECTPETQVGLLALKIDRAPQYVGNMWAVYNLTAPDDETAVFGTLVAGVPVKIVAEVRTDGDHGIRAHVRNLNEAIVLQDQRLTLWGVPADPVHDGQRWPTMFGPGGTPSTAPRRPFITAPPRCDSELTTDIRVKSWQTGEEDAAESTQPALSGCDALTFTPSITVTPRETEADQPAGYDVDLEIPQGADDPDGKATAHLKKATVTLPEGVAISPSSATGLEGCAAADTALGTLGAPKCPEASKIGTVKVTTPLLEDPLDGEIVLRSPEPGRLFRLLLVAHGPGIELKLPGEIYPDAQTGRITAVFDNNPQLPFSKLELSFKGGSRAPLVNPKTCGEKTATSELTSYAGNTATDSNTFEITDCSGGFIPSFEAGMTNPLAGTFSAFTMTIRRPDGGEDIGGIALDLPPGLLGMVASVPQCPEAQAAAGTCGDASRVGSTTVESGTGPHPFPLTGKVFLAGPYKGAPFSLSVVVRAIAGPYDLGTVVVRAPINVDAANAKIGVPSDPIPTILEGVPLRIKTLNITIDRPGFMFNPTNCDPMAIQARIAGTGGTVVSRGMPFRAQNCAGLPLQPKLSLGLKGPKEVVDGKHPGLTANLTQAPGEAGLKKVAVKLPLSLALDPDNAQALCTPGQAVARTCPATSIVGRATAVTPALNQPLSGPIYFVENTRRTASGNTRRTLPKLWLALKGEVPLDLYAESTVVDDHLVATFNMVPDAPISKFDLSIDGGEHGILAATQSICERMQTAEVTFDGQNGKRVKGSLDLSTECGFRVASATRSKTSVTMTISGLGAGKLEISGKGLVKSTRTIKQAKIARATARLSKAARRTIRSKGRFATRVTVKFTPANGGKPITTGAKVTFKR